MKVQCSECEVIFFAERATRKTCSEKCRQARSRRLKSQNEAPDLESKFQHDSIQSLKSEVDQLRQLTQELQVSMQKNGNAEKQNVKNSWEKIVLSWAEFLLYNIGCDVHISTFKLLNKQVKELNRVWVVDALKYCSNDVENIMVEISDTYSIVFREAGNDTWFVYDVEEHIENSLIRLRNSLSK